MDDENLKHRIVALVSSRKSPTLEDLCLIDEGKFAALRFLLKKLIGLNTVAVNDQDNDVVIIRDNSGTVFLEMRRIDDNWQIKGELALSLYALLAAVRIHEVDSYDWVYLPPEIRFAKMSLRADEVGTSTEELQRLMRLWTA